MLVIVILMASLIPPLLSGLGAATDLKGAARRLAAGLRSARNEAVTTQKTAALTVNLEQRYFTVTGNSRKISLPSDNSIAIKLVTAQSELIDETIGNIRFFPDGASTGGHISLANERIEYRVSVAWLTGRIHVDDMDPLP